MRGEVQRALDIDDSTAMEDRTVDITTTGRRSGEPRRIEIVFYRRGDDIYLSGVPMPKRRDWLANLADEPHFTFHLKRGVVADLPAVATVIEDEQTRREVLATFVEAYNRRWTPDMPWPRGDLEEWVAHSPLARVTFPDAA